MTRELPILFSTPMVQAIQADTKNQTRRTAGLEKVNESPDDYRLDGFATYFNPKRKFVEFKDSEGKIIQCKPRYIPGDKIWVKETYCLINKNPSILIFKANVESIYDKPKNGWKSSLFMRKEYSRIWLECTGVRCERADGISESDAINEGIGERKSQLNQKNCYLVPGSTANWAVDTAAEAFKHLWNSINLKPKPIQEKVNGKLKTTGYICYPFDNSSARIYDGKTTWRGKPLTVIANPWVFIYDFKRIEKP